MNYWVEKEWVENEEMKPIEAYYVCTEKGRVFGVLNWGISVFLWKGLFKESLTHNLVLSYEDLRMYIDNPYYLGCIIGRYAGRISGASYQIKDKKVKLESNEKLNTLHGGFIGLSRVIWDVTYQINAEDLVFEFTYKSPCGEGGFLGNVDFKVTCHFIPGKEMKWFYEAVSDTETPISLTHHTYYNLNKEHSVITNHLLTLDADFHLALDDDHVPTPEKIRFDPNKHKNQSLKNWFSDLSCPKGLDHAFKLNRNFQGLAAELKEPVTGLTLSVESNCPYMVVYTGGYLKKTFTGICFETQEVPNGPHLTELGYEFLKAHERYFRYTRIKIKRTK